MSKRFTVQDERVIKDNERYVIETGYVFSYRSDAKEVCNLLNKLYDENKLLKSDLAVVIEQARKNDKFLRSDIRILENALWCPSCANDIKRLKELRREFKHLKGDV